jgi:hypothetical protein
MTDRDTEEAEDIFQEGLTLLGEQVVLDDGILRYGHLTFTTAPKVFCVRLRLRVHTMILTFPSMETGRQGVPLGHRPSHDKRS